jgi:hypothetical protein
MIQAVNNNNNKIFIDIKAIKIKHQQGVGPLTAGHA